MLLPKFYITKDEGINKMKFLLVSHTLISLDRMFSFITGIAHAYRNAEET
jgi:hypothetical protein